MYCEVALGIQPVEQSCKRDCPENLMETNLLNTFSNILPKKKISLNTSDSVGGIYDFCCELNRSLQLCQKRWGWDYRTEICLLPTQLQSVWSDMLGSYHLWKTNFFLRTFLSDRLTRLPLDVRTSHPTSSTTTRNCEVKHIYHCFVESEILFNLSLVRNSECFSVNLFLKIWMVIALTQA